MSRVRRLIGVAVLGGVCLGAAGFAQVLVRVPAAVTVTITTPTTGTTYDAGTSATLTTLGGTATSVAGLTSCTWANTLGGSGTTSSTSSAQPLAWTVPSMALTVGANVLTVTCTNTAGGVGTDVLTVTRTSESGTSPGRHFTGVTRTAATCATGDVQTQVTAANDGDIVQIPNGSCPWSSGISTTKKIWIRAQNYTETAGGTGTRNVTITNNSSSALFAFTTGSVTHVAISGIRFNEGTGGGAAITFSGSGTKVPLISDCYFELKDRSESDDQVIDVAAQGGVMWNTYISGEGFSEPAGPGGAAFLIAQPRLWNSAPTWGADDTDGLINFYVEDSTFFNASFQTPDVDGNVTLASGSRAVIRYSLIDGTTGLTHGFTSVFTGRHVEYYNNTFRVSDDLRNHNGRYFWLRGGTVLFTDNVVNNADNPSEYGSVTLLDIGDTTSPAGSYPVQMGPCRGHNGTSHVSDPCYIWNNTGARGSTWDVVAAWDAHVDLNRDIFVDSGAKPGYTKYTYPHVLR